MKMRSKEGLDKDDMTEQFRKAQLRLLNMPRHAGVLPIHEVLEDDKFYYIVMSKASDLYSVGVILYMLLAGAMPYDDAMFEEVLDHKRQASPGPRRYNWRGAVFQRMKETSINWNCEPWP